MDYSQRLQCEHTYTADRGQDYRMKLNRSVQIVALCRQFNIWCVYASVMINIQKESFIRLCSLKLSAVQ